MYVSETRVAAQEGVRNNLMMVRWMCSTKLTDKTSLDELKSTVGLFGIEYSDVRTSSLVRQFAAHGSGRTAKTGGQSKRNW